MHFPPDGVRSIGIANAWARYGSIAHETVIREADERSVAVGMLETKEMGEPIEDILRPLDVAFIGPSDLAIEFGLPSSHPEVKARVKKIEDAARKTDTLLGYAAKSPAQALELVDRGYRYIALSNDVAMLAGAAEQLVAAVKKAGKPPAE
jgi:4-hydroxy-2-oxoheptanedioate aldolase